MTAADLASALEVSVATARRDLEALSAAGIPVYPQPGRKGGWQLLGGARTDLSGLTADEARALFVLAGPATAAAPALKSALRKLVRALPEPMRDSADAAAAAVVIDPGTWGATKRRRPGPPGELEAAVIERAVVELDYRDREGARTRRAVEPLGLVDKGGVWYLLADTAAGRRTFRVDRIGRIAATGERFERPADFDLQSEWQRTADEIERRRGRVTATVRLPDRYAGAMRGQWGRHVRVLDSRDGVTTVEVADQSVTAVARQLAGWGEAIEVVGPPDVREELGRIGAGLVARYARPDEGTSRD